MSFETEKTDKINYGTLLDDAMYKIIHDVLEIVSKNGLQGNHYFYIAFSTQFQGVLIPRHLIEEYPYEMTIVLQYQFEDLQIHNEYFEVVLNFNGIPERLVIPIKAITSFFDPSVQFGIRFRKEIDFSNLMDTHNKTTTSTNKSVKTSNQITKKNKKELENNKIISINKYINKKS